MSVFWQALYVFWVAGEVVIAIGTRRTVGSANVQDRGTQILLWIIIVLSLTLSGFFAGTAASRFSLACPLVEPPKRDAVRPWAFSSHRSDSKPGSLIYCQCGHTSRPKAQSLRLIQDCAAPVLSGHGNYSPGYRITFGCVACHDNGLRATNTRGALPHSRRRSGSDGSIRQRI